MLHRFGRPDRPLILAAAAYAGAVGYLSWPLATALAGSVVDPVGLRQAGALWARADLDLLVWILAWTAHAIVVQPLALFQANIFYPAPDTLAASEHLLGLAPIAAPLFLLSGNAVLTYNVTALLVAWTTALCTFALARAWTASATAAFLAGAAFAFAPLVSGGWIRLHASAVHFFPLILLLAWRGARAPRLRPLVLLTVVTAFQLLAGMYVAYELLVLLLAFAPALQLTARRERRRVTGVVLALAAAATVLIPVGLPYLRLRAAGELPSFAQSLQLVTRNSVPPPQLIQWLADDLTGPVIALALVGLAWPARADLIVRCGLLSVALVGIVLSAGTTVPLLPGTSLPGPYELAMLTIPGFASMRAPSRFIVLPLLALSVLAAFGAARLASLLRNFARGAPTGWLVIAAGLALVVERAPARPLPLAPVGLDGPTMRAHRYLRDHATRGPVLELPVYNVTAPIDGRLMRRTGSYMVGSTLHWFPLLNGYSGYAPGSARLLTTLAQRLPDTAAFDELCRLVDIRWIIVHFALLPEGPQEWTEQARSLGLELVERFGEDAIYRVARRCTTDPALIAMPAGDAPRTTLGGVLLAPLAERDRRGALATDDVPHELVTGSLRWLTVEVTNESTVPWPGLSPRRAETIELRARWRDAASGRIVAEDAPLPLARDLWPGETMRAQVSVFTPPPGNHVLEIGLAQNDRGWFVDQGGTGALRIPVHVAAPRPGARHDLH